MRFFSFKGKHRVNAFTSHSATEFEFSDKSQNLYRHLQSNSEQLKQSPCLKKKLKTEIIYA